MIPVICEHYLTRASSGGAELAVDHYNHEMDALTMKNLLLSLDRPPRESDSLHAVELRVQSFGRGVLCQMFSASNFQMIRPRFGIRST